ITRLVEHVAGFGRMRHDMDPLAMQVAADADSLRHGFLLWCCRPARVVDSMLAGSWKNSTAINGPGTSRPGRAGVLVVLRPPAALALECPHEQISPIHTAAALGCRRKADRQAA